MFVCSCLLRDVCCRVLSVDDGCVSVVGLLLIDGCSLLVVGCRLLVVGCWLFFLLFGFVYGSLAFVVF